MSANGLGQAHSLLENPRVEFTDYWRILGETQTVRRFKIQRIQYHFIRIPSIGFCLVPHQSHPGDTHEDFIVPWEANSVDSSTFFHL